MGSNWITSDQLLAAERALAERAASELKSRDSRWRVEVTDNNLPGTVWLHTWFGENEQGPTTRIGLDTQPEWWATVLTETFQHPSRERARKQRSKTSEPEETPEDFWEINPPEEDGYWELFPEI